MIYSNVLPNFAHIRFLAIFDIYGRLLIVYSFLLCIPNAPVLLAKISVSSRIGAISVFR